MTPAGQLSERVTIERRTFGDDSPSGAKTPTWATVQTVWASVRPRAAAERESDGPPQIAHTVTYDIVIRYRSDMTPRDRLTWRGKPLDIVSMYDPDNTRSDLVLTCTTRT